MAGAFEHNFRESPAWSPPEDGRGPFDAWAATTGTDWAAYTRERPGMNTFALEDGVAYHTYSAYARPGRPLRHVPVARPGAARAKRGARPGRPAQRVRPPRGVPPRKRGQQITRPRWPARRCTTTQITQFRRDLGRHSNDRTAVQNGGSTGGRSRQGGDVQ
jgi:hypothetical protein